MIQLFFLMNSSCRHQDSASQGKTHTEDENKPGKFQIVKRRVIPFSRSNTGWWEGIDQQGHMLLHPFSKLQHTLPLSKLKPQIKTPAFFPSRKWFWVLTSMTSSGVLSIVHLFQYHNPGIPVIGPPVNQVKETLCSVKHYMEWSLQATGGIPLASSTSLTRIGQRALLSWQGWNLSTWAS